MEEIELDEKTIFQMQAFGFVRWNEKDQIHEMTDEGHKWLREYLDEQFKKHGIDPQTQGSLL